MSHASPLRASWTPTWAVGPAKKGRAGQPRRTRRAILRLENMTPMSNARLAPHPTLRVAWESRRRKSSQSLHSLQASSHVPHFQPDAAKLRIQCRMLNPPPWQSRHAPVCACATSGCAAGEESGNGPRAQQRLSGTDATTDCIYSVHLSKTSTKRRRGEA